MASQTVAESAVATRPSLTLKRRIDAPPEKIYAAWTQPENLIRWFGPAMVKPGSMSAEIDARVGGSYRIRFDTEVGEHHEVGGHYCDVQPNRRLVFTWAWHSTPERESLVTVTLKPDDVGTLLTLHHEQFFDRSARDRHERGWTELLDKLGRHHASHGAASVKLS
jgi:uncharacterized protein YndB with AHSA1/START domain